jgi:hypothetical protein
MGIDRVRFLAMRVENPQLPYLNAETIFPPQFVSCLISMSCAFDILWHGKCHECERRPIARLSTEAQS